MASPTNRRTAGRRGPDGRWPRRGRQRKPAVSGLYDSRMNLPLTATPPTAAAGTATHRAKQSSRVGLPPRGASLAPSPYLARPSHRSSPHPRRSVRRSNSRQAAGQCVARRGAQHTVTVRSVASLSNNVAVEGVPPIKCLPASRSPLGQATGVRSASPVRRPRKDTLVYGRQRHVRERQEAEDAARLPQQESMASACVNGEDGGSSMSTSTVEPLTSTFGPSYGCLEHNCRPHAHRRGGLDCRKLYH